MDTPESMLANQRHLLSITPGNHRNEVVSLIAKLKKRIRYRDYLKDLLTGVETDIDETNRRLHELTFWSG